MLINNGKPRKNQKLKFVGQAFRHDWIAKESYVKVESLTYSMKQVSQIGAPGQG